MELVEELWRAYGNWKRLTEQEAAAIRKSQWPEVRRAQLEKRALQSEIIHLTEQIDVQPGAGSHQVEFQTRLRKIVNELILLETQNNLRVQHCIESAEEQRRSFEATSCRLRRIQSRYVPSCGAVWNNLS